MPQRWWRFCCRHRAAAIMAAVGTSEMVAPDLITVEVLSVLRRLLHRGQVAEDRASEAVADLAAAPIRRVSVAPFVDGIWELRGSVSAYDACYVALAQALSCSLISCDARLARASGLPVAVVVP